MPVLLTVWISHFERLIICELNYMKVPADIRLHTSYTDWPDGGAVMKGQKTGCCTTCWILMKPGEMMHLNTDWSEVFVSSFGTAMVPGGVYLSKYSYSWVHYQIKENVEGKTPEFYLNMKWAHMFLLTTKHEVGCECRGVVFWRACDVLSLSLSLMLKWLEKESEALCEAVIRAELQKPVERRCFSRRALHLSLCCFDDMKWDQVGAEMDRHKDTRGEIAFQS